MTGWGRQTRGGWEVGELVANHHLPGQEFNNISNGKKNQQIVALKFHLNDVNIKTNTQKKFKDHLWRTFLLFDFNQIYLYLLC